MSTDVLIRTREEFMKHIGPDGRPTCRMRLAAGCLLSGLTGVTSLAGVTFADGCRLDDLTGVTSLAGVTLAEGCWLYRLTGVTSLDGATLAEWCGLTGLLPWHVEYKRDAMRIGCEPLPYDITDKRLAAVIRAHKAEDNTDKIRMVVEAGKRWKGGER